MIKCAFSHGQHNYERKVTPMTNEQRQYLIDLLYTIDSKQRIMQYSESLTAKIYFTEQDLKDLRTIITEVVEKYDR